MEVSGVKVRDIRKHRVHAQLLSSSSARLSWTPFNLPGGALDQKTAISVYAYVFNHDSSVHPSEPLLPTPSL